MARVRALVRRTHGQRDPVMRVGGIELDTKAREELQQRVLASSLCREDANTVVTALESLNYLEDIIREKAFSTLQKGITFL